jgi:hypothetical protein
MAVRFWSPQVAFPALLAASGLVYAAVLPPCQAPDEHKHFLRAYHLSEGHPGPVLTDAGWVGGDLPESVDRCADAFKYLRRDVRQKVDPDIFRSLASEDLSPEKRRPTSFQGAEQTPVVGYIPPAAAIALGRLAGLNALGLFYLGRLANLAAALLAVSLAIRITPVGKLVFAMVALLPLAVQQFASLSPDASNISASFLLTALLLRAAVVGLPSGWGLIVRAGGLAAWVTACKLTLAPLILLALGVSRSVLGSWLHYLAGVVVISAAVLLPIYGQLSQSGAGPAPPVDPRETPELHASPEEQRQFVRSNPLFFLGAVGNTWLNLGGMYIDHLFTLGWVDTPVPHALAYPYGMLLLFVALASPSPGMSHRVRLAALAAVITCTLVIFIVFYILWTAPRSTIVFGVQGRYFLPFLPLALVLLSNQSRLVRIDEQRLLTWSAAGSVAEMIVSVGTMAARYYSPSVREFAVIGGSALFAAVAALAVCLIGRRVNRNDVVPVDAPLRSR